MKTAWIRIRPKELKRPAACWVVIAWGPSALWSRCQRRALSQRIQRRIAGVAGGYSGAGGAGESDYGGKCRARQSESNRGMANGPTTPEADEILRQKGVALAPDVYPTRRGHSELF